LERETFPRQKLCAGWVTPEVLADLDFGMNDYPHGLLALDQLKIQAKGLRASIATLQYSIRRFEFDAWLLERSGAPIITHNVKQIEDTGESYVIDGQYACRYLIGAGGTRCPVHRQLFRPKHAHPRELQCVTLELEYQYQWHDEHSHLWFGKKGLPGYSWYVPKAGGYLNIGVGGTVANLAAKQDDITRHWTVLAECLADEHLVTDIPAKPKGYSYFLRDSNDLPWQGRAYAVGDAAGLATRDMCEGIGPAVKTGLLAAQAIAHDAPYDIAHVAPFTLTNYFARKGLQRMMVSKAMRL
jgi:flavin-dependent dehydrogenase